MTKLIILCFTFIFISGCSANDSANQVGGKLIGGATGAFLGSKFGKGHGKLAAVGIGALVGAQLGGHIGSKMDEYDKAMSRTTAQNTLENAPDNQVSTWKNPNRNHSGKFKVTKTQEMPAQNKVCRDYVQTVMIDGEEEKIHGRACRDVRDPKAQWFVQK